MVDACAHERITTWRIEDTGEPAGLWSCAACGLKFVPLIQANPWSFDVAELLRQAKGAAGVALPVVRELTLDEIDEVYEQPREFDAFVYQARDLMHKFCEVNGLTLSTRPPPKAGVTPTDGGQR